MTQKAVNPAARQLATRSIVLGVVLILCGVLAATQTPVALGILLVGVYGVWSGLVTRSSAAGADAVNRAIDATTRGELATAQGILERAGSVRQLGYLRRSIDFGLARVAFRRGDLQEALRRSSAAAAPQGRFVVVGREYARATRTAALGLRAMVHAARGDAEAARKDAQAVRTADLVTAEALARAALAEAIVLEKAGDRPALREHLARHAAVLREYTTPRERAIVRAYRRMLKARTSTTAYRESAPREEQAAERNEPSVEDWIAAVAPGAVRFARVAPAGAARAEQAPRVAVDPKLRKAVAGRLAAKTARGVGKLLAVWVSLIVFFLAVWQFLTPSDERPALGPLLSLWEFDLMALMFSAAMAIIAGSVLWQRARARRATRALIAAARMAAKGAREDAERAFVALVRSRYPLVAAQAHLQLAHAAEGRGAFADALDHCDRGLAIASTNLASRALAGNVLIPELLLERAVVLAATGREAEAQAEMDHLTSVAQSPFFARGERRFELLMRVRRGDLAGAAAVAGDDRCDASMPARDDLLGEVARVASGGERVTAEDVARVREDLRDDAASRAWIEAVAPSALAALDARERASVAGDDAEAEREAQAVVEAEAALRVARA